MRDGADEPQTHADRMPGAGDRMIKLTPSEVTALKELATAGPRGRKSRPRALDPGPLCHRTISKHGHRGLCDHGPWPSCPGELKGEGKVFLRPRLRARSARRRYNAILSLPLSSLGT